MKRILIIVLILGLFADLKSQQIDFFSESLTFRLQDGSFEVEGLYYMRNNTDAEIIQTLFYPFPDVKRYGKISFVSIIKEGETNSLLRNQTEYGAVFNITLKAKEEAAYHIRYIQELKTTEAKYIITTTQVWKKPFEEANYQIEYPLSMKLVKSSIEPDTTFQSGNLNIYRWNRKNFMPTVDFEFRYE